MYIQFDSKVDTIHLVALVALVDISIFTAVIKAALAYEYASIAIVQLFL